MAEMVYVGEDGQEYRSEPGKVEAMMPERKGLLPGDPLKCPKCGEVMLATGRGINGKRLDTTYMCPHCQRSSVLDDIIEHNAKIAEALEQVSRPATVDLQGASLVLSCPCGRRHQISPTVKTIG